MPIEFTESQQTMKYQTPMEDSAMLQKQASILLSESQQVIDRMNGIDSRIMAQDFSLCIGWGRVKVCVTIEEI
ncbi:hypothetical protein QUB68_24315 [Microcoleus sp. A006_D1]|uniref:hypothetical protein n=1 Tax=Microcoleus sp. A006_D1 TaxID=3055267 RepID=UPI002FD73F6C